MNGRKVGVTLPAAQRMPPPADPNNRYAPAGKVTNIMACSMVLVRFGDRDGMAHQVAMLKVGEGKEARFFMPEGTEQWTKDLKPVAPWLAEELAKETAQIDAPNEVPTTDAVDVTAGAGV